ncbi:hypothetical protein ACS0TY_024457 [Phlomoides rotata]
MQRLPSIAFREILPPHVWKTITNLNLFFKDPTSRTITVENITRLETYISVILCKMERILPPNFFNSMGHLHVYLAYGAKVAGPI